EPSRGSTGSCAQRMGHDSRGFRGCLGACSQGRRRAHLTAVLHGFGGRPCKTDGVAHVLASQGEIIVKLNPVEQFFAWRRSVHVPVSLVRAVSATDHPLNSPLVREVKMGFAARTAPGRGLICCGPRATWRGGQALLVVYGNSRSIVIELAESSPKWRLL